jgi:lysophospholipid hydrolase
MRDGKSDTDEELNHLGAESSDEDHHIDGKQGYQLLTEVKNGASMSSLFSILTLFTEDIQLRDTESSNSSSSSIALRGPRVPNSIPTSPRAVMDSPSMGFQDSDDTSHMISNGVLPSVPPLHLGESRTPPSSHDHHHHHHHETRKHHSRKRRKSVHPDIVARAMVDTTIAIIPASAFQRRIPISVSATRCLVLKSK